MYSYSSIPCLRNKLFQMLLIILQYVTFQQCLVSDCPECKLVLCRYRWLPIQNFIQALLSSAVFHQIFSFLTICLVQWFCGAATWSTTKGKFLKSRSADCYKMHLSWIFFWILEFHGEFWIKVLMRKVHETFLYAYL